MRVLCVLLVCFVAFGCALPPRYYAARQIDDDDDADDDVSDSPYFSPDDDMYTFPSGGPGGPPANRFLSGPSGPMGGGRGRTDVALVSDETYLGSFRLDLDENVLYQNDEGKGPISPLVARQLLRMAAAGKKKGGKEEDEEEAAVEDEEEQEDEEEEDDDDADDEPDYAVPDMTKLFPNPDNRPRGPGDYDAYVKHMPQNQPRPAQRRQNIAPPPPRHNPGPPPRRYRYISPNGPYDVNTMTDLYDTVVVDADDSDRSRILYDDSNLESEEDQGDDADADDDADYSVPRFDTLFPAPSDKRAGNSNLFHGVSNTWNSAKPPGRYGRVIRLFQQPMFHDVYNPDYVVDPMIAVNRRNERLKNRYSGPHWKNRDIRTPYNYKPILYQKGHWGNPREHDYNPVSGHHYLGGIYNGNKYY